MDRIKLLIAEVAAGAAILLIAFGLYNGLIGSLVTIPEAAGVWLILFLALLAIIDIFLIIYTMAAWERE